MVATLVYMETTNTTTTPATFKVGQTVATRSACDHDMVLSWTVVSRSAKFVTLREAGCKPVRVAVHMGTDGEWAMPWGRFSMAPVVRA